MFLTEILFGVLLAFLSAAYYISRRNLSYWQRRGIPCDPPHWFYGNIKDISDGLINAYKHHVGTGPFCGFYFLHKPTVIALSPDFIKQVLIKDFNNFTDRGLYCNEKDDPLSGHLFVLDGQKWRSLRNKLSPTFTSGQMRFMLPTVLTVADKFVDTIDSNLEKSDIIEIKELLARFTTDVIGSCAFGIECNSLQDPKAIFREMGRLVLKDQRHSTVVNYIINALPNLARSLHVCTTKDKYTNFFMQIVRETVDYRQKHDVQRKDFLNILMDLNKGASKSGAKSADQALTIEQMSAQAFVFFLAGFETSSTTLSFILYELALNLDVQQRLRAEILATLEKYNNEITYECVSSMPYMKQVIAETLRKYPIVPQLFRKAESDYIVPEYPKYVIEKGTSIYIPVRAIHHNPEIYPEPEKFDPERFTPEAMQARDSINWLPFGYGPRNCIGLRFGQMQMRVALTYLLRNFEICKCHLTEIPLELLLELNISGSKNGIQLKLKRIAPK